ncbi:iron complex outermembrane recepter protein [Formosa sp. Hel1_31_208]|uniref:TonB-dependent receptor n=1 Tax=Formosa sp. Hel1_31_208 TaxID=1798225 RepID=UPI00087C90F6|nr:TonB-dependent receptor [Formosa sp. Hel1_31_208]SDS44318.1 iron complex outermembrane recepter protein [Formosa sp. Hel1_31_208]
MKYLLLCIAFMTVSLSASQNCSYTFLGELSDFHDASPISGATIYIKSLDKYVVSDIDGKFKIENLCKQQIILVISHIGCETKTLSYNITGDVFESIQLEHHIEALNEVAVTTNATPKESTTAQETVLKSNTLRKYSALNLGDALKEVTGVSSINTGNSIVKPMINGMHSSRLLVLNNNVRMQDQEWGIEHAPNIDINSANQISVIKGSGTLAYGGDAIGGIIVINPVNSVLKDTLYGKTVIGGQTNGRGYNLSTTLNKSFASGWFANVQASLKQNGDFETPDYVLTNTGLKSNSVSFRAGKKQFESGFEVFYSYINNDIGILRASHIGNINDLVTAINNIQPLVIEPFSYDINSPKQEVTHHLFKASYYKRFRNFGKLNLQYDYQNNQRFEFDVRVGNDRNKPALDLTLQTHTFTANTILDANNDYKLKFGGLGRYQNNFANPDTGVRRLIPDYDRYDFGGYITTEWFFNEKTTLDAGIRYDFNRIDAKKFYQKSRWEERGYDVDFADIVIEDLGTQLLVNPVFDFHNVSISAGINYSLNDTSNLLVNYSLASRPPNPSELFSDGLHHSAARIELGDLRLGQEISNRFSGTYNYNTAAFSLSIEAFYNRIADYMFLKPFGIEQTIRGAFPVWNYEQTNASLYGLDVSANYEFSNRLILNHKSAYIKGDDLTNNTAIIDIPAFNTINEITYQNPKWNNFSASLKSEWVFEQTEFPDYNFDTFIATSNQTVVVDISTPPPAYHLLHFYSDVNFNISDKTTLNIALSITNLLDTNYRSYLNRLRYFADDLGRNMMIQLQLNY